MIKPWIGETQSIAEQFVSAMTGFSLRIVTLLFLALVLNAGIVTSLAQLVSVKFLNAETGAILPLRTTPSTESNPGPLSKDIQSSMGLLLDPGTYSLTVTSPNFEPWTGRITVHDADAENVRIWMQPATKPVLLRSDSVRMLHQPDSTIILGYITDSETGDPIEGTQIECDTAPVTTPKYKAVTKSDSQGYFQLRVPVALAIKGQDVQLSIQQTGYAPQKFSQIELWPGGDWIYRVQLTRENSDRLSTFHLTGPPILTQNELLTVEVAPQLLPESTSLRSSQPLAGVRIPANIRVLNGDGTTVDYVSLQQYTQRVLPSEWFSSWAAFTGGSNSLMAGAVVIRTYAIGAINHPKTPTYDICGTTACQMYGPATSTYSDLAVSATEGYVVVDSNDDIPLGLTEYSAENNSLGLSCGDGFTAPVDGCLLDAVCQGETRNGHGRGMCQWGTARWATGLKFPGNSTRDRTTLNGFDRKDWTWIIQHYYPNLRLVHGEPLRVGDAVQATTTVNVRGCSDGSISNGIKCPVLTTKTTGSIGVIVDGPTRVLNDGGGYTWFQVRWSSTTGWSAENFLERFRDQPLLQAHAANGNVYLSWTAQPDLSYVVQQTAELTGTHWQDLSPKLSSHEALLTWIDPIANGQRFYRVIVSQP